MMFKEALANSSKTVTKLVFEGRLTNAMKFLEQNPSTGNLDPNETVG